MYGYHFGQWLFFFYFYCIFGWCFESVYVSLKSRSFVNRGFLKGPWLPLYGSGAILVLCLTLPFQHHPALVYLVGMIGATILEYMTGEAMVQMFKVRYWDYSNQKFQFRGHICLTSSIAWGFLSLLMVYVVHKYVESAILWMNQEVVSVLTFLITVCMVYDFSNAFREAMDLRDVLIQSERLFEELEKKMTEKKRLLEAAATFTKVAIEEAVDEKKEAILQSKEAFSEKASSLLDIQPLEEKLEQLKIKMTKYAENLLLQNPRAHFMTMYDNAMEIRERIIALKSKKDKKDKES